VLSLGNCIVIIQSNLVVLNSVNSNLRLYRSQTLVPAMNHYKRRGKHRIYRTQICRTSDYIEQTASLEASQSLFISNVWGHWQSATRSVNEMRYLHHYQVVNTRLAADGVTSRRLPLPSTRCCHCCIYLRVLGKTLSKQLHQQPVDFPFSE